MIRRLVGYALQKRMMVLALALTVLVAGLIAFKRLDIEAYPNPVPPMVEVIVQPPGWSAEETERYVTIPLEIGLSGMPGLDHVRSQSLFGLSDVKCYFKWGTSYKDARQEVINRLQFVQLPAGITAQLSPWNAIGEIYRYVLRGKGYSLSELKTAQDWILDLASTVSGVKSKSTTSKLTRSACARETSRWRNSTPPSPTAIRTWEASA